MRKSCSWRNTTAGEETGLDLVSRPRLTMDDGRRTSIEEGIAKIRGRSHPQAALEAATQLPRDWIPAFAGMTAR